jgi:hypothetical protein
MSKTLQDLVTDDPATDAHRHAYNAAFDELGLNWHWDAATYAGVRSRGRDGLRTYLEREQAHLLRAYEADFLVNAIESVKARCQPGIAANDFHHPHTATAAARNGGTFARRAA